MNVNKFTNAVATSVMLVAILVAAMLLFLPMPARAAPAAGPAAQPPAASAFTALDSNQDKSLSLQEFQAGYASVQRAIALEVRLREQFKVVDANRSGAIEAGEYTNLALVKRVGKAAPGLATFDANKNQKLEFAEYLTVVHRLAASQPADAAKK